jgi:hypothetical protein
MLYRSTDWLISRNLAALALAIYASGFINFPSIIAHYNVAHSREVSGKGVRLDVDYLFGLGPQAIPAFDRYAARPGAVTPHQQQARRDTLAAFHRSGIKDWRAWSFRGWRLERYLRSAVAAKAPALPPPVPAPELPG